MDELRVKAGERLAAGEPDIFDFISTTPTRQAEELIERMWAFQKANQKASEPVRSRIEALNIALEKGCCENECKW